jgi:hypothetical protein
MMTEQLRVSILAAPLAAIDPRALSQAWYSALRGARGRPPAQTLDASARAPMAQADQPAAPERATPVRKSVTPTSPLELQRRGGRAPDALGNAVLQGRMRTALARSIQLALVRRAAQPARAAFVVGDGNQRALIVVHSREGRTRLVAMCAPAHRDAVARALDQVRASLRVRGIAFESRIEAGVRCF